MKFLIQTARCDSPYPAPTASANVVKAASGTSGNEGITYDGFAFLRKHRPGLGVTSQSFYFSSNSKCPSLALDSAD
jgi:hypothetical protein